MRAAESVVTRMAIAAEPARIWKGLLFFEEIRDRAPLLLRLLLPAPLGARGEKSSVGDEALCLYEGGRLVKRVTQSEPERRYAFDVVVQELRLGGGMRLRGGAYELRRLAGGATEVAVSTRYESPWRPGWLWRPLETAVCRAFHRHLLGALRRSLEPGAAP